MGKTNQVKSKLVNFENQNDLEFFVMESKNRCFYNRKKVDQVWNNIQSIELCI